MSESIELATILVTDLVGSTRLETSVGPARADELRDEHFAVLREVIGASGGHEFRNTGDGLMVAFSSASAAVQCAVSMQQLFERRYRRAEQKLQVRIGLGAGESTVQDGEYFGMPSIEAARLCDKAPADGILASSAVRMLASRLDGIRFDSVGELELKGFSEPVEAFAVPWTRLADEAAGVGGWPLPALLRSAPRAAFVGRETERALDGALAQSGARGDTAGGAGLRRARDRQEPPGVASPRMARTARGLPCCGGRARRSWRCRTSHGSRCARSWWSTHRQRCSSGTSSGMAASLRDWRASCRDGCPRCRSQRAPTRRPNASCSSRPSPGRSWSWRRRCPCASCSTICTGRTASRWRCSSTWCRPPSPCALQVIVAFRDSDLGKDHPLGAVLADLRRIEGVERIALEGLGAAEVSEVMAAAAGHELDEDALVLAGGDRERDRRQPVLRRRGASQPGRVRTAAVRPGDGAVERRPLGTAGPAGKRARRDRPPCRAARGRHARGADAGGRDRPLVRARAPCAPDRDDGERAAGPAGGGGRGVAAGRVDRTSRPFPLLPRPDQPDAVRRARRDPARRACITASRSCSKSYTARIRPSTSRSSRCTGAWPQSTARRRPATRRSPAGMRSRASRPREAAKLFADALGLLGPVEDAERCRALIGLGEAQQLIGDPAYRETLLDAARIASSLADADLAAAAALANTRGFSSLIGDLDDERVEAIERALELDDRADPGRRAQLLALQSQELLYEHDRTRRQALATEAIALARDIADPKSQGARAAARVPRPLGPRHGRRAGGHGERPARQRAGGGGSRARVLGQLPPPAGQLRDGRFRAGAGRRATASRSSRPLSPSPP